MLLRSVVTRLLIFPTRLLAASDLSSASLVAFDLALDFVLEVTLAELACTVSSLDFRVSTSVVADEGDVSSPLLCDPPGEGWVTIEASSGVVDMEIDELELVFALSVVSAFTRMRSACSKTSWVIIPSARTRVRV